MTVIYTDSSLSGIWLRVYPTHVLNISILELGAKGLLVVMEELTLKIFFRLPRETKYNREKTYEITEEIWNNGFRIPIFCRPNISFEYFLSELSLSPADPFLYVEKATRDLISTLTYLSGGFYVETLREKGQEIMQKCALHS